MKKITFKNRLEAISWIAENAEHEGQFEVLREMLTYNFIYFGAYFQANVKALHGTWAGKKYGLAGS